MKTSLVIMAAGIGSRFGKGIKQLEKIGPSGEIIMDYSVHDAIEAGFDRIVFIIRKEIEKDFDQVIGKRIKAEAEKLGVETAYVFQSADFIPEPFSVPEGRTKPWGTGQAVLCCKEILKEPFAVINADDYYGKEAFRKIHSFLLSEEGKKDYCMAGFVLRNTLSDNGGVTRGVCKTDEEGFLLEITETKGIVREGGKVVSPSGELSPESSVSMNMWGFTPDFTERLEKGFTEFMLDIEKGEKDALTSEFLIPVYIEKLLSREEIRVRVLPTSDKWFGMTYREDTAAAISEVSRLIEKGIYRKDLFSDIVR